MKHTYILLALSFSLTQANASEMSTISENDMLQVGKAMTTLQKDYDDIVEAYALGMTEGRTQQIKNRISELQMQQGLQGNNLSAVLINQYQGRIDLFQNALNSVPALINQLRYLLNESRDELAENGLLAPNKMSRENLVAHLSHESGFNSEKTSYIYRTLMGEIDEEDEKEEETLETQATPAPLSTEELISAVQNDLLEYNMSLIETPTEDNAVIQEVSQRLNLPVNRVRAAYEFIVNSL